MQFKDLPEYAKQAACNALSNRIIKNPYDKGEAKAIRDAFIALYSEPENAGEYENLDSVVKEATCSILCKKYSPCGTHVGNVYIVVEDEISDSPEVGKFRNMFVFAPKGEEGVYQKKYGETHDECAKLIRHQLDMAIDAQNARQAWEELLPTINLDVLAHVLAEHLNSVGRKAIKYSK